eukprot:6171916-Pleurochrysis_carterae.AAC.4
MQHISMRTHLLATSRARSTPATQCTTVVYENCAGAASTSVLSESDVGAVAPRGGALAPRRPGGAIGQKALRFDLCK